MLDLYKDETDRRKDYIENKYRSIKFKNLSRILSEYAISNDFYYEKLVSNNLNIKIFEEKLAGCKNIDELKDKVLEVLNETAWIKPKTNWSRYFFISR